MVTVQDDETARLAALRQYRILDTEPERAFDDLALLASQICETPIALITLVDADRQWFKARTGIAETETPRAISFCTHAIKQQDLFIVPDARDDDRFRDNPLVTGGLFVRFYAGAPLVTPEGHALGTICVIDCVPRTLTAEQREALDALRRQVQAQLELRRNLYELKAALKARDEAEADVVKLSSLIPYCSTCQLDLTLPAEPSAIPQITDGVTAVLRGKRWPEEDVMAVELSLQEAIANAVRHGCQGDPTKRVQCCVNVDAAGEVVIVVRDPGPGFDPSKVPDPLGPENLFKPSGRGVFLINGLMDQVTYTDGGREVQMRKRSEPV
ncbi:MAG TPA: ATP-binding protein [Vicinamibacterales bacterium]|nr:ATP-binding protein [Vicinamibacterales bacterium]